MKSTFFTRCAIPFNHLSKIIMGPFLFSQAANAQNIKIYTVKDTMALWDKKYKSKINWGFYKVDMDSKTIQKKGFAFGNGDKAPDLTKLTNLFKDVPKDWFPNGSLKFVFDKDLTDKYKSGN
ncbi:hypothetical protein [Pedobacter sp. SL55]|uniref:hypothetical protein n=1 Tax=Pedobacter sp. SL55 TaxID=2995161 RepID=UPI00226D56E3|nr:hypothetical protein [Pedobacter sp. SL55]WAC42557.1 hypothetical protein OVA16_09445 [Pedobacter sp. SL55]